VHESYLITDMLKLMKEKNISLDVELGPEKMSTLHLAVNVQDKKILKYLLSECNIRINATDAGVCTLCISLYYSELLEFTLLLLVV